MENVCGASVLEALKDERVFSLSGQRLPTW